MGREADAKNETREPGGVIFIQTGENEFYKVRFGIMVMFENLKDPGLRVGILKNGEGRFEKNQLVGRKK